MMKSASLNANTVKAQQHPPFFYVVGSVNYGAIVLGPLSAGC